MYLMEERLGRMTKYYTGMLRNDNATTRKKKNEE